MKKLSKNIKILSKYVKLNRKKFLIFNKKEIYHSFIQQDYITIIAITKNKKYAIVKQFRNVIEKNTLEFPGGTIDSNESPIEAARRELAEEAGIYSVKKPVLFGRLYPDVGRLENKLWVFYIKDCKHIKKWKKEKLVKVFFISKKELLSLIKKGKMNSSVHLSAIALLLIKKII